MLLQNNFETVRKVFTRPKYWLTILKWKGLSFPNRSVENRGFFMLRKFDLLQEWMNLLIRWVNCSSSSQISSSYYVCNLRYFLKLYQSYKAAELVCPLLSLRISDATLLWQQNFWIYNNRKLKQRRQWRHRERQKSNRSFSLSRNKKINWKPSRVEGSQENEML